MDYQAFFNSVRGSLFGGKLSQSQVDGMTAIIEELECHNLLKSEKAYMLATAYHETARTMLPIEEYGKGKGRRYGGYVDVDGSRYTGLNHIYYGRGYVQLTWLTNYAKAKKELGIDFVNHPELALVPSHAAQIMILGMQQGWFTSRKLSNYFSETKKDYTEARRIINGMDRADLIAGYARKFEQAL